MKKYNYTFLAIIILLSTYGIQHFQKDKRLEYVEFINKDLQNIRHPRAANENSKNIKEGKSPDQPEMAALQDYYQTMDPVEHRVPQERLLKAYQQTQEMRKAHHQKYNEDLQWENIPSNMGGRTRAIMWDPNSASGNGVWAGAVTGGIWHNEDITDANSQWEAVDDFMASLSISSLCYDPNNSTTFYAGTGEAPTAIITYRESSGRGLGIWKSTDSGASWSLLESTQDFAYITDIKVRDEDGQSVIYAGVASGIYMGENHLSQPTDGLYRSEDGGQTWEQVLPNINGLSIPYTPDDIEIGADGRIYLGTMRNIDGNGGATLLFSDVGTSGSWTVNEDYKNAIEAGIGQYTLPGRTMVSPAPSNENIVYAIIGAGYISGFGYYKGNFVIKSTDKGQTWTSLSLPDGNESWASLSWHAFSIDVDPNNPDHFYVGGLDEYHSLNGGNSYTHVSDWSEMYYGGGSDYIHADQHNIQFKPGSSDEIIFSSDGGIFYTNNGSNSYPVFQERNSHYSTLMFYTCDIKPDGFTNEFMGGLQDNGTLLYQGDPLDINDMIDGGDGAFCFYDKNDGSVSLSSYYYNRYTIYVNGNFSGNIGSNETGTFVSPADFDYDNNILYGNGVGFFGEHSNQLFRGTGIPNNPSSSMVSIGTNINTWFTHITYSPYSPVGKSTLFVGSNAGDLFKVEEAQSSSPISTAIGSEDFPTAAISCIAIGGSEDTLLVTFSNYGVSSVWQTYDGGSQWKEVEANLPDMPIRWAIYHPHKSKQALIATEMGVWSCTDLTAESPVWEPAIEGLANVRIDMLKIRESDYTVLAATHGRGLFTTNWEYNTVGLENQELQTELSIIPNPSNGDFSVELAAEDMGMKNIKVYNSLGSLVYEKTFSEKKIFLPLSNLTSGNYVLTIKTSNNHYSKAFIIQ